MPHMGCHLNTRLGEYSGRHYYWLVAPWFSSVCRQHRQLRSCEPFARKARREGCSLDHLKVDAVLVEET